MNQVSVDDAKTHLSRLVERVAEGEEFLLVKDGRPVARLVPVADVAGRRPGSARGHVMVSADFDGPLPDEIRPAFAEKAEEYCPKLTSLGVFDSGRSDVSEQACDRLPPRS